MYSGATNGFKVKSWRHTALRTARHHQQSVAHGAHCISYAWLHFDEVKHEVPYLSIVLKAVLHQLDKYTSLAR